ncbi:MAG: amino acid permease [Bacillota bacterium]|nr:amino acid permease [Bacillota bacterium]
MKKTEKGLSALQLAMMALGTVIGGSFFLGSSVAIHAAGPSILLGFIYGGMLVYFILYALSEMTVANPDSGSFRTFAADAFGPGAGFVVGWVYWTGMILAMSSEATAVSILVRVWAPTIPIAILGSAIISGVTLLNLLGANRLSKLESGLAAVKLAAIVSFIIIALLLIVGAFPGNKAIGAGELANENFMPGGITGLAGSMLIVMFSYAGFEIIGLASSEAENPKTSIPKAIRYTVISLVALYIISVGILLPLIPTVDINENTSPIVAALNRHGIDWAGNALNIVLITAILSTMLAAMFGLGRMMRSLADEGHAPEWLKNKTDVPYRGILASGVAMLIALGFGLLFPRVYLFLISSGGFAILFSYAVIMATHIKFRKKNGCPDGKCQMWGFPYTSVFVLLSLIAAIISMPFVKGQASGLIAGSIIVVFYTLSYAILRVFKQTRTINKKVLYKRAPRFQTEQSKEIADKDNNDNDQ